MKLVRILMLTLGLSASVSAFAINDDIYMEYTQAVTSGDIKYVKKTIDSKEADVNEKFFGWSALQMAANAGKLEMVKYLVGKGAELDYLHPASKNTALQLAALNGHREVVKYLIEKGADKNIKLKGDVSVIRPIRESGNQELADYLISLGISEEGCQGSCY